MEAHDERLRRSDRLFKRAQFFRCFRSGKRRYGRLAVVHYAPNEQQHARLGVVAGKRIGNAVARHRAKRRVREIFRRSRRRDDLLGFDVVVQLKPGVAASSFEALRVELEQALTKIARREV